MRMPELVYHVERSVVFLDYDIIIRAVIYRQHFVIFKIFYVFPLNARVSLIYDGRCGLAVLKDISAFFVFDYPWIFEGVFALPYYRGRQLLRDGVDLAVYVS